MFNLEKELDAWRRSLRVNPAFLEEDVEELEEHLRDHVAALTVQGVTLEDAYRQALKRIGSYGAVEAEYRKVSRGRTKRRNHLLRDLTTETYMLRNYLILALRRLRREKVYAGINILGLSVAVACVLLVFLYVRHEFSFDNYHEKGDRIYRVAEYMDYGPAQFWNISANGDPVTPIRSSYTDVEDVVTMSSCGGGEITLEEEVYRDVDILCAESNLFNIFSFELIHGDPATVLDQPHTAVITRTLAERLFKDADPIGKSIHLGYYGIDDVQITGLMEDVPDNSHRTFDLLLSYESLQSVPLRGAKLVYVLLKPGAQPDDIAGRLLQLAQEVEGREGVQDVLLEPLKEIYFSSLTGGQGNKQYVYLLSAIALVILSIACANYMNMATARSSQRGREVGVRKTLGAQRTQLVRQFMTEALLMVVLALPLGLLLLSLAVPTFNQLADTEVALDLRSMGPLLGGCAGILAAVGLIGGSYPAIYLSGFDPIRVLKGRVGGTLSVDALRKVLVVSQFAASIVLIVATGVILRQLHFTQQMDMGFDADQVVIVRVTERALAPEVATLKQEFIRSDHVVNATAGSMPGQNGFHGIRLLHEPEGENGPKYELRMPTIDSDFIETMRVPLVAGRNIDAGLGESENLEYLANRATVRTLGWNSPEEAIGHKVYQGTIVGVVEDFHFESLHEEIRPLVMQQRDSPRAGTIALRLRGGEIPAALADLERTWKRLAPDAPFEYSFLRDEINLLYEKEQRTAKVFGIFAGLAIMIACLGLFGLAAFTAEQRRKEIGIRKVLGASVTSIITLLSRDFVVLVLVAVVLASPVAYLLMKRWLEDFAYRIPLQADVFMLSGLGALAIAVLTVSYQAVKAAQANPVESLRYE